MSYPCSHPANERTVLFEARDYITGDRFEIVCCRGCGFTVTMPQPSDEQVGDYYPSGYYGTAQKQRFPWFVEALQRMLYKRRVQWVESVSNVKSGRVLDVGCGRGLLLKEFQRQGWTVQGTELSDSAAGYARDVLQLPVQIGRLENLQLPSAHFDVVMLWHVLEHISDPRVTLREANRILKPGGVLLVGVPNFGSAEARFCRDKWFHLDVPRHLTHLTRESLKATLAQTGFEDRSWSGFAPEYDTFSFTQSLENRCGLRHNLLYNVLRRGPAKVIGNEKTPGWQAAAALLLAAPLGLLSLPATFIAGLAGNGATMTVLGVKKREVNPQ